MIGTIVVIGGAQALDLTSKRRDIGKFMTMPELVDKASTNGFIYYLVLGER